MEIKQLAMAQAREGGHRGITMSRERFFEKTGSQIVKAAGFRCEEMQDTYESVSKRVIDRLTQSPADMAINLQEFLKKVEDPEFLKQVPRMPEGDQVIVREARRLNELNGKLLHMGRLANHVVNKDIEGQEQQVYLLSEVELDELFYPFQWDSISDRGVPRMGEIGLTQAARDF